MSSIRPTVHPVEAPPLADVVENPPVARMQDLQGMPGTFGGFLLRFCQFFFAVVALSVMASSSGFSSAGAFRYLLAAMILQGTWSLSLALVDLYTLLVKRSLRDPRIVRFFTIGDEIPSTLTFAAACASAGMTASLTDLDACSGTHCTRLQTTTVIAFISWFAASASFILNFWTLTSY